MLRFQSIVFLCTGGDLDAFCSALSGFIAKQRRSSAWRAGLNRCPTDVEEKICALVAAELEQYKLAIQKGPAPSADR